MVDTQMAQAQNKFIPLLNKWAFYYDEKRLSSSKPASSSVTPPYKCLGTFETVQGFWGYWNNIHINKLPESSNLRLFKSSIGPPVEDVAGGKWVITCEKNGNISQIWLLCVLAMIGEQFESGDYLCGSVLSIGKRANTISLWTKTVNKSHQDNTERDISRFLNITRDKIRFQRHRDSECKSFSIKLSRSVDLSASCASSTSDLSGNVDSGQSRTPPSNDDELPFLDLTKHFSVDDDNKPEDTTTKSDKFVRPQHRKSLSEAGISRSSFVLKNNSRAFAPEMPSERFSPYRLAISIDSASFRRWRHTELSSKQLYQLPKLHRRRGRRKSLDKAISTSPRKRTSSHLPSCIPTIPENKVLDFGEPLNKLPEHDGRGQCLGIPVLHCVSFALLILTLLMGTYLYSQVVAAQVLF